MEFLEAYQRKLGEIYEHEKLFCLSDYNDKSVEIDGMNPLHFLSTKTGHLRQKLNKNNIIDILTDEIIVSTSRNIKFALGNVYLFKEFGLNDFSREKIEDVTGEYIPNYAEKFGEMRYMLYVSICFEKLYNFWDRIGDLLHLCFELDIPENKVYFPVVIDKLSKVTSQSNNFHILKNILYMDYKGYLNSHRKKIVHYHQLDTYYRYEWRRHMQDQKYMDKLQQEKESFPEDLKRQMHLTKEGVKAAGNLIEEIKIAPITEATK